MKWTAISLMTLTGIMVILWLVIGGPALAIALSVASTLLIVISAFSLGIWYAHKSIQLGAKLAIEAQSNNDQWDTVKMQSLAQFGGQILKLKGGENIDKYPLLESKENIENGEFIITGIDTK